MTTTKTRRKPKWMKSPLPKGKKYIGLKDIVKKNNLHTICTSGNCPNMGECWSKGTATFMILGDICTRRCGFCNTKTGKPHAADYGEPKRVAESVKKMGIKHAVITSVDRDDLDDAGSEIWAMTVKKVKEMNPGVTMETLIPDFDGKEELIQKVGGLVIIDKKYRRLTPEVRTKAKFDTSLKVLEYIASKGVRSKSGIMLGLGETEEEVLEAMRDLRKVNCEVLTIGQYLQPTDKHLPIMEFVTPEKFKEYEEIGLEMGFKYVESGPLVRSSYHAEKHVD